MTWRGNVGNKRDARCLFSHSLYCRNRPLLPIYTCKCEPIDFHERKKNFFLLISNDFFLWLSKYTKISFCSFARSYPICRYHQGIFFSFYYISIFPSIYIFTTLYSRKKVSHLIFFLRYFSIFYWLLSIIFQLQTR